MKIWATSDTHFNHINIIKYCDRPFTNIDDMNSTLIHNWNSVISNEDIVFFCGDFIFARPSEAQELTQRFANCLHGHKIIIKGNHDFKKFRYIESGFEAEFFQEMHIGRFLFCHRPDNLKEWHNNYDFVFYGHTHQNYPEETWINCINVCLDANNLMPLDITDYFTEKEIKELNEIIKLRKD